MLLWVYLVSSDEVLSSAEPPEKKGAKVHWLDPRDIARCDYAHSCITLIDKDFSGMWVREKILGAGASAIST